MEAQFIIHEIKQEVIADIRHFSQFNVNRHTIELLKEEINTLENRLETKIINRVIKEHQNLNYDLARNILDHAYNQGFISSNKYKDFIKFI